MVLVVAQARLTGVYLNHEVITTPLFLVEPSALNYVFAKRRVPTEQFLFSLISSLSYFFSRVSNFNLRT